MQPGTFFMAPIQARTTSVLYGIEPQGTGTGDVESLHSYLLTLAHAHSMSANTLVRGVLPLASRLTGNDIVMSWGWDKDRGATLLGATEFAARMSGLLAAASGRETVRWTTLSPTIRHVCGQALVAGSERVCLECLQEDLADGRLPYGRLLWRLEAVQCCPRHLLKLTHARCGKAEGRRQQQFGRRKLGGSCGVCGALAYGCASATSVSPTPNELWRAQQCAAMLEALPQVAAADPLVMKDAIGAYCARTDGPVKLAQRIDVPKSSISRWLNKPAPRISLAVLLDIAASEGFSLAKMLQGDLARVSRPAGVEPTRARRPTKRLNHFLVESALKAAIAEERSIQDVAGELQVDPSTLARHEVLYSRLRDRSRERNRERQTAAHKSAVAQAEDVLVSLVRSGQTPSLRNASALTGQPWRPSQMRAIALQTLRMQLGGRHLRSFCKASNVSDAFHELVASAAERMRLSVADPQQSLPM